MTKATTFQRSQPNQLNQLNQLNNLNKPENTFFYPASLNLFFSSIIHQNL
jgi:hypothetical protein